ncbi:RDD family protein [Lacibacterium aquatile]|uniref:RDD family protein n=1 Tax=Lacibacterium aquatile TaxID=1168082 RepID=A0ABW5DP36_9PROT
MTAPQWWYIDGETRRGPYQTAEVDALLKAEVITPATLIWCEDMAEPAPISSVDYFAVAQRRAALGERSAPWIRLMARAIDLSLWMVPLSLLTTDLRIPGGPYPETVLWTLGAIVGSLTLLIALLADAVIMALFGTTLGKSLFDVTVLNADGSRLGLRPLLRRNALIWFYGLGLNVPGFSLFRLWVSYREAAKGERSPWDAVTRVDVRCKPAEGWSWCIGLVLLPALWIGPYYLIAQLPGPAWTHPETGITVDLLPDWQMTSSSQQIAKSYYIFSSRNGTVSLSKARANGMALDRFAKDWAKTVPSSLYENFRGMTIEVDAQGRTYAELIFAQKIEGRDFDILFRIWRRDGDDLLILSLGKPSRNPHLATTVETMAATLLSTSGIPPAAR